VYLDAGSWRGRDTRKPIGKWVKPTHERAIGWDRKEFFILQTEA